MLLKHIIDVIIISFRYYFLSSTSRRLKLTTRKRSSYFRSMQLYAVESTEANVKLFAEWCFSFSHFSYVCRVHARLLNYSVSCECVWRHDEQFASFGRWLFTLKMQYEIRQQKMAMWKIRAQNAGFHIFNFPSRNIFGCHGYWSYSTDIMNNL